MIDLSPVVRGEAAVDDVLGGLGVEDLRRETAELFDRLQAGVFDCVDADLAFVAAPGAGEGGPRSIAQLTAQVTATCEEAAFLAAELARGVPTRGGSYAEVDWRGLTTVDQVRERIAESRRICLACLEIWPSSPDLALTAEAWPGGPPVSAVGRHATGLAQGFARLPILDELCRLAKEARG